MIMAKPDTPFMDAAPSNGAIGLLVGTGGATPPVDATVGLAAPTGYVGTGAEVAQEYSVTVTVSQADAQTAKAATVAKRLNCILTVVGLFSCLGRDLVGC